MIRALLADDEQLALFQMENLLAAYPDIKVAGTAMDSALALELASVMQPDVVFLDIHMPEMNGLHTAELIQQAIPGTDIVFVTAHGDYALEAFDINALDYLLKPISKARLAKTVHRLQERLSRNAPEGPAPGSMLLHVLGSVAYSRDGLAPQPLKWRTTKAQELFLYLLHHRNRIVGKDEILQLLWPDFDHKKGSTHLYTTIYQIKQCLKQASLDIRLQNASSGEGYTLDADKVKLDAAEWEAGVRCAEEIHADNRSLHQKLFDMYRGEYLSASDYLWAEGERERLRVIWLHHASKLADSYLQDGLLPEAVTLLKRVLELNPYYEEGYLSLMKLYDRVGDRAATEACFAELKRNLEDDLGVRLSPKVLQWYDTRREKNSV
ncbi:response regulator [Paenibacillus sp. YN15]|uniref:response regulator n=1 Tax=Paenibacillus sp. YN15 TaxID=1742774 RepID=UPI0015ECC72D|nr:response regulator [Paenibacillus sp. YN15]